MTVKKYFCRVMTLLGLVASGATFDIYAQDVLFFGVIKSALYTQESDTPPAPIGSNAYAFNAFVLSATNASVTNATVRIPNGSTRQMSNELSGIVSLLVGGQVTNDSVWMYSELFATKSGMDTAYPSSGSLFSPSKYRVTMETVNDGLKSAELSYLAITEPPTPQISNLAEARNIDTTASFKLTWNSMSGGLIPKMVQLAIMDQSNNLVLMSPLPMQPGAFDGNSTSTNIPPGVLPPDSTLTGHLMVLQPALPNTNYAIGIPGLLRDTTFTLTTRPLPKIASTRMSVMPISNQVFTLQIQVETNRNYVLQSTTLFDGWTSLATTSSPTGVLIFTDDDYRNRQKRFFRILEQ